MQLNQARFISFLESDLSLDVGDVDQETLLFSSGIVDSFSLVSLMTFIEEEEKIKIYPGDVTLENFDSISRILNYLTVRESWEA